MRRKSARDAATADEMLLQSLQPSSAEAAILGIEAEGCNEQRWHNTPPNQLSHLPPLGPEAANPNSGTWTSAHANRNAQFALGIGPTAPRTQLRARACVWVCASVTLVVFVG